MTDELLVLGSASATPTGRRFPSAYALSVTGGLFLIDCGAPVSSLLYHYNLDPLDVKAIFLSHWHMDHVAGLGLFLSQCHQLKRSNPLRIYGPRGTRGKVKRLLLDSFMLPDELSYKLKITNVKIKKNYKQGLLRVSYFRTEHLEKGSLKTHFGRKAMACGMIFKGPGWQFLFSGDINDSSELNPYVKSCDLLVHEMAHQPPEAVANFAKAAKVPHVLVSHIARKFDETPEKIKKAFKGRYSGDLIIAEDGTKVRLSQIRKKSKIEAKPAAPKTETIAPAAAPPANAQSPDQFSNDTFLSRLQVDLNLAPEIAQQVLQLTESFIEHQPASELGVVNPGKIKIKVGRRQAPSGPTLAEKDMVTVTLTIDAGLEDTKTKDKLGTTGLRRQRILRLYREAMGQGGILTQDEMARLLNVSVRTIRRDLKLLQADGHDVQSRGQLQ